jgi:small-conductance mechanosensitive channel
MTVVSGFSRTSPRPLKGGHYLVVVALVALLGTAAFASQPNPATIASPPIAERTVESATLSLFNRPIVVFRARVLGRGPAERVRGARRVLDELVAERVTEPVDAQALDGYRLITVASRGVFAVTPADVEELSGETLDTVTAQSVARLRQALDEEAEARKPGLLLRAVLLAAAALAAGWFALRAIASVRERLRALLVGVAERQMARILEGRQVSRALSLERPVIGAAATAVDMVVVYAVVTFVLRQFPYTRPWGESMRGFLFETVATLGLSAVHALPGLFTVVLIMAVTRVVVRLARAWFEAVEHGQARAWWIHPETAQPTRRLVTVLLWLLAAVVSYPYLPGSDSEAFKGLSVFLGVMVTFGSSGIVNQIMSGFMITYSRALRAGDFVRLGDVEGTVEQLGVLSVKLRSLKNEAVTIPNAVVVSQTMTDYSRLSATEGVFTPTSVTIGYDAPWRQVHALLLLAAARTQGLRETPKPVVLQAGLEDFYVKYTLFVCLEHQQSRPFTMGALHANIQDLFNEHGVQIMSPNYVFDPAAPKLVPKDKWFAAPGDINTR